MQFLHEMFKLDPTASGASTPVGQFRLNYAILSDEIFANMNNIPAKRTAPFYFMRSKNYFVIKYNAVAKNGNHSNAELPIRISKNFS